MYMCLCCITLLHGNVHTMGIVGVGIRCFWRVLLWVHVEKMAGGVKSAFILIINVLVCFERGKGWVVVGSGQRLWWWLI